MIAGITSSARQLDRLPEKEFIEICRRHQLEPPITLDLHDVPAADSQAHRNGCLHAVPLAHTSYAPRSDRAINPSPPNNRPNITIVLNRVV
jgi:hypothetical protein